MPAPVNFGKRGPPPPRQPPRRLRSGAVVVGAIGVLALGLTASAGYREYRCRPPEKGQPEKDAAKEGQPEAAAAEKWAKDERPAWCSQSSRGYTHHYSSGYGGHSGWGFFSGHGSSSSGGSHGSFGGFGGHGSGHGGG